MAVNLDYGARGQSPDFDDNENEPKIPSEEETRQQELERHLVEADELEDFETHDHEDLIYREYDPLMISVALGHYERFDQSGQFSWKSGRPEKLKSWLYCVFCVAQTTLVAGIFVGLALAFVVYLDLNLADICYSYRRDAAKIPVKIIRLKTISYMFSGIIVQFWHFVTLLFVFNWQLIRSVNILSWNILAALVEGIFKLISGIYMIRSQDWSMYPSYCIFIIITFFNSIVVARHFQRSYRTSGILVLKLAAQFLVGIPLAFVFITWINPLYKSVDDTRKVIFASFVPVICALPKMLTRKTAQSISRINHPGTSVYLVSAMYTSLSLLYRILQVQVSAFGQYVALSVVFGIQSIFERVSLPYFDFWQHKIFNRQLRITEFMTPRQKRLMADIYLLNMIMEPVAIIVSCTSMAIIMYFYGHDPDGSIYNMNFLAKVAATRISTAIAIEFVVNIISSKVETFYFNMPVNRVWQKKRKWLVFTVLVNSIIAILCFSRVFYKALSSADMFDGMIICSGPFQRPSIRSLNYTKHP